MAKTSLNNQFVVGVFNNIWDTDNENLTKKCNADVIMDIIATGDYGIAEKINGIRNAANKEQRDELKKHLFVITWQGVFSHKNNNGCVSLSSLVCIDIDHRTKQELDCIKQTISGWPCVLAFFMSPSGDGLKVIIRTDNYSIPDYGNCYRQVEKLFTDAFGILPDSRCEDLSHPCYISHDPDIYYNPDATSWHYEHKPEFDKPKQSSVPGASSDNSTTQPDKPFLTAEGFIAEMNRMRCTLTDEQIIKILDIRWSKFPNNYQDGNRTKSMFVQACWLCKAGIEMDKALDYLKSKFLPTGFSEDKLEHGVYNAYEINKNLFGSERSKYRSYNEYKSGH